MQKVEEEVLPRGGQSGGHRQQDKLRHRDEILARTSVISGSHRPVTFAGTPLTRLSHFHSGAFTRLLPLPIRAPQPMRVVTRTASFFIETLLTLSSASESVGFATTPAPGSNGHRVSMVFPIVLDTREPGNDCEQAVRKSCLFMIGL